MLATGIRKGRDGRRGKALGFWPAIVIPTARRPAREVGGQAFPGPDSRPVEGYAGRG